MRTLLLPLTASGQDRFAIETGLTLSAMLNAHLTLLLPQPEFTDVPVYGHYATTAGFAMLVQNVRTDSEEREAEVLKLARSLAGARGIAMTDDAAAPTPSVHLRTAVGEDSAVIGRFAAVHDMILFPRVSGKVGEPLPAPSLLKNLLQDSGRPLLVVTDNLPGTFGRAAAIAWNGSQEGARAVTAALPFLARAERVVIVTIGTSKTRTEVAESLRQYLERHGIRAQVDQRETDLPAGEELLLAAAEAEADLLVTGGYTHSRMRQTLFGGVTHHLLEQSRLPMLMAH